MHDVHVTVISFARLGTAADGGVATGSVSGSASTLDGVADARRGRRRRGAGRIRRPRTRPT